MSFGVISKNVVLTDEDEPVCAMIIINDEII